MKRIRVVALLLVVLVLFSACGGGSKDNSSVASVQVPVDIKTGEYYVVFPKDTDYRAQYALPIYKVMKEWEGMKVYCADDSNVNDVPEIIIGDCNRTLVSEAYAALGLVGGGNNGDYIIYEKDRNIVITGYTEEAIKQAVDYFINTILPQGTLMSGVAYYHLSPNESAATVTVNNVKLNGNFRLITPQYNMSYIVRMQINELEKTFNDKLGVTLKESTDATTSPFTQELINSFSNSTWGNCETDEDYQNYLRAYNALDKTKTPTDFAYEIVIGDCDRAGRPVITNKDEYTIKIAGNKIYLTGGSVSATAMAVSEFNKMISGGNVALTDASTVVGSYNETVAGYNRDNYYTLTWSDDFEGNAIDTNKWHVSYGRDDTIYSSGLNGRTPARASKDLNNNYVQDGKLYICAAYDKDYYYGGHLSTKDKMHVQYGYVEISCLKPFGQGFWTTLWVDNQLREPGLGRMEIDVNESYGPGHLSLQNSITWINAKGIRNTLSKYGFKIDHGTGFNKSTINYGKDTRGFHMDFHTFGYGWDKDELFFTVDGKETARYNYATEAMVYSDKSAASANFPGVSQDKVMKAELEVTKSAFATPAYLRLSMAVGFAIRKHVVKDGDKEWTETNKFVVDYVHIYQLSDHKLYFY